MSAADWPLLDPAEEEALHLNRLLTVDERPFQRITKRLLVKDALISKFPTQLPTPPPDATQDSDIELTAPQPSADDQEARQRYYDDVLFDFAQLESTLIRIQFLKDANERERARYAAEKSKILATAQSVRDNTATLRDQLSQAQKSLALKKQYDDLAEAIYKDKALKARDVLEAENEKLRAEIEDLEQEGRDFGGLWRERKERFDKVVDEGKSLVRFIKGEKDEEPGEGEEQDGSPKGETSIAGTPRPDTGAATPMQLGDIEGADGAQAAQQALTSRALGSDHLGSTVSGSASPTQSPKADGQGKDTEMMEAGRTPLSQSQSDSVEEGEAVDDESVAAGEKMDTT